MPAPSSLPEWGTGGSASIEEPTTTKKQLGWVELEKPPAAIFNWLGKVTYDWLLWITTVAVWKYQGTLTAGLAFHPEDDGDAAIGARITVTSFEGSGTPSLNDGARTVCAGRSPAGEQLVWSWAGNSNPALRTFGLNAPEWTEPEATASLHHMHGGRGLALVNITGEDSDGGRESPIEFWGTTFASAHHRLGRIQVEHDGAAADTKGRMLFAVNDGSADDDLSVSCSLDSGGTFTASTLAATTVTASTVTSTAVNATTATATTVNGQTVNATVALNAPNVPVAMARLQLNIGTAAPAILHQSGVSSFVRTAVGTYTLTLSSAMAHANAMCMVQIATAGGAGLSRQVGAESTSTTTVVVYLTDSAGAPVDPAAAVLVNLLVFSPNAWT